MAVVTIRGVTRENWREALRLAVHPEQLRFVSEVTPVAAIALAKAYVRPGGLVWEPYAIYADARMVGFVELAYQAGSADQYWLYHFFIDRDEQGKGYGPQAMRQFIAQVAEAHPPCRRLQLTVHPDNDRARALYTGLGFARTEQVLHGEPVYALTLG